MELLPTRPLSSSFTQTKVITLFCYVSLSLFPEKFKNKIIFQGEMESFLCKVISGSLSISFWRKE